LLQRVALVTGVPYTLTIADASGRELYREEDKLIRFMSRFTGREGSTGSVFGRRENWTGKAGSSYWSFRRQSPGHTGCP